MMEKGKVNLKMDNNSNNNNNKIEQINHKPIPSILIYLLMMKNII